MTMPAAVAPVVQWLRSMQSTCLVVLCLGLNPAGASVLTCLDAEYDADILLASSALTNRQAFTASVCAAWSPPKGSDGTPSESANDLLVRMRQVLLHPYALLLGWCTEVHNTALHCQSNSNFGYLPCTAEPQAVLQTAGSIPASICLWLFTEDAWACLLWMARACSHPSDTNCSSEMRCTSMAPFPIFSGRSSGWRRCPKASDGSAEAMYLMQIMSITETQWSGSSVIIISPDSDCLSVLQAAVLGTDLRNHAQVWCRKVVIKRAGNLKHA